jgi:hypothetical protein
MPLGKLNPAGSNQSQSIELDRLSSQGTKLPEGAKGKNSSGLTASESSHQSLDPQGRESKSVKETSFTTVALKGGDSGAGKKVEGALLKIKSAGDHTSFKHFDNLFTGNKAGFTQIGSLGKVVSGGKPLTKEQTIALSEELVAGVGLASKKAWDVGRGVVTGITSASKLDNLKDSVASLPINKAASTGATGINTAFAGIAVIKSSVELVRDLSLDALAHKDRKEAQALLENYEPKTGVFSDPATGKPVSDEENQKLTAQLKGLLGKGGSDRSRTKTQIAGDRLSTIRDTAISGATVANAALTVAGAAAKFTPGISQAISAVSAAKTTWQATTNIVALNNIQHAAKQAKDDDFLLQAVAAHVSQERVYNSRKHIVNAAVNFTAVGVGIAALAAGPGAPAALAVASIVTTAATTAVGLGVTAFELGHAYQLSQRRKEGSAEALELFKEAVGNDALSKVNRDQAFIALADPKNIGLAERALIDRLQNGSPEEVKTAVKFLEDFGLSKGTISKLKLASTEKALTALQSALYTDKVAVKLAGFKQIGFTLGKVTGISQFASFVKTKWNEHQIAKANGGRLPFESWIVSSVVSKPDGSSKVTKNRSTKDLIRGLNTEIHNYKSGKVSQKFEKLRDQYLQVKKPRIEFINREPVKIGANIELDEESAWNPKTGRYEDF